MPGGIYNFTGVYDFSEENLADSFNLSDLKNYELEERNFGT